MPEKLRIQVYLSEISHLFSFRIKNMKQVIGTLAAVLLGFAISAAGQESAVAEQVCNEDFARTLVEQQADESRTVAETDKRIRILIRSGEFLWKLDQPQARDYFSEAFRVATERFSEKGFERKVDGGLTHQLPDYRFEVVRAIAKRDGKWAQKLTEDLLKEYEKAAAERKSLDKDREINDIMSIATDNVKTNPALSWQLFRRLMREQADHQWFWTLYGVAMTDRSFADALYLELLTSQANASPRRFLFLSAYPFARERIFGYDSQGYGTSMPEGFEPQQQLQLRFIDAFLRRADTYASDPANLNAAPEQYRPNEAVYIATALSEMEPIIIQRFPAFLPRFASVRSKAFGMLSEQNRKDMAERDKFQNALAATFERRMEEIEKADEEGKLKDAMIVGALLASPKTDEQFARLEPWINKIVSEKGRGQFTNYFWFLRAKLAIKDGRYDDARRFATKVPELQHSATLIFEIAEKQLSNLNDTANAYQTLADVSKAARQAPDSAGKARVLLGLAHLYERMNHSFAISELADAVAVINKLEGDDLLSSSVMQRVEVKDFSFFASFSMPGYSLENTFATTSKQDFSLPLSNAKTINDKFYRTIAVIAVAKNCIDRARPRPKKN